MQKHFLLNVSGCVVLLEDLWLSHAYIPGNVPSQKVVISMTCNRTVPPQRWHCNNKAKITMHPAKIIIFDRATRHQTERKKEREWADTLHPPILTSVCTQSSSWCIFYFYYMAAIFSYLSTSVAKVFLHESQGSCRGAGQVKMLVGRWCANAASVPGCQSPWKRSAQACRLAAAETLERSRRRSSGLSHRLAWAEYLMRMHR